LLQVNIDRIDVTGVFYYHPVILSDETDMGDVPVSRTENWITLYRNISIVPVIILVVDRSYMSVSH